MCHDELQVLLRKKAKPYAKFSILMYWVYIYFFEVNDAVEEATCK